MDLFNNVIYFPRNALMFNNELMADVHFIVGRPGESQKVPAHKVNVAYLILDLKKKSQNIICLGDFYFFFKFSALFFQYVLAVGSSVFGAMFYGDLAEGKSEIHIPDVEPAAFLILLK